jgi:hypothetical protein
MPHTDVSIGSVRACVGFKPSHSIKSEPIEHDHTIRMPACKGQKSLLTGLPQGRVRCTYGWRRIVEMLALPVKSNDNVTEWGSFGQMIMLLSGIRSVKR